MNIDDATPGPHENFQDPENTALHDDIAGFLGLVDAVADRHVPAEEVERRLQRLKNKTSGSPDGSNDEQGDAQPAGQADNESPDHRRLAMRAWQQFLLQDKPSIDGDLLCLFADRSLVEPAALQITAAKLEANRILAEARRDAESYADAALKSAADTLRNAREEADRILTEAKAEAALIRTGAHTSATSNASPAGTGPHGALDQTMTSAEFLASNPEAAALWEYLHQRGMAHHDITPSNLIVPSSNLWLIDDIGRGSREHCRERLAALVRDLPPPAHLGPLRGSRASFTFIHRIPADIDVVPAINMLQHINEPPVTWERVFNLIHRLLRCHHVETTAPAGLPLWAVLQTADNLTRRHPASDLDTDATSRAKRLAVALLNEEDFAEANRLLHLACHRSHTEAVESIRRCEPPDLAQALSHVETSLMT
jgi:vacuolar-type H+-ATPase subunit H